MIHLRKIVCQYRTIKEIKKDLTNAGTYYIHWDVKS